MSARERDILRAVIAALKSGDRAALGSFAEMLGVSGTWKRNTPSLAAAVLARLIEGGI